MLAVVALPEVLDEGQKLCCWYLPYFISTANIMWSYLKYLLRQKLCCWYLPYFISTANIMWPYLKYFMRDRSCAVGLCLESLLSSLTAASCRGTGTLGSTLWSWSSSCNSRNIDTGNYMHHSKPRGTLLALVTICTTVCHVALYLHSNCFRK
jgi:hypothetical protein